MVWFAIYPEVVSESVTVDEDNSFLKNPQQ